MRDPSGDIKSYATFSAPNNGLADRQGVTLENTEKPKCGKDDECLNIIAGLDESERPLDISGNGADPKCR
jgi:hypothetical protein